MIPGELLAVRLLLLYQFSRYFGPRVHLCPDLGIHFQSELYIYCVIPYLMILPLLLHFGRNELNIHSYIDSPSVAHNFSETQKQCLYTNMHSNKNFMQ